MTKVKFKPVVAQATKVDEQGKEIGSKEFLKIEVPYEDDAAALRQAATDGIKEETKKGDIEMEEKEVERILGKKLEEMDIQKTIKGIGTRTEQLSQTFKEKTEGLEERLEGLGSVVGEIKDKQEEACTGVECVKGDIGKLSEGFSERIDSLNKEYATTKSILEEIQKRTDTVLCKGEEGCNAQIPVGSSFCPNCGKRINKWTDIPSWVPYSKRK